MALLLKTISHLGYVPDPTPKIPEEVRALAPDVRAGIDALLVVPESAAVSGFEGLKADTGKAGVDNLQAEIEKLRRIRAIGVGSEPFANVPWKVLQMLKRRASKETASEMRDHSNVIRFALMASYLYVRTTEPEPQSLGVIKEKIGSRYGMLDL